MKNVKQEALGPENMRRQEIGRYEIDATSGETVRTFVPAPLPPVPPLDLGGRLQQLLESATLALGRLDGISAMLPDRNTFLYAYVRKEALLSSQIEGTQSSLSDLLLYEVDEAPGFPIDDVVEVSNYVAALDHGLSRLESGFPLSNRLIREVHGVLLSRGRGSAMMPGEFRRSQNWIGGTRPGNAAYVPPPHTAVLECMGDLERFLHARDDWLPTLIRAGLAHAQFETIHPFLDGNGRVGRLLITLLLYEAGALSDPLLYLSLYFKQNRGKYYELLNHTRLTGDWEEWIEFFLDGVQATADGAVETSRRIDRMFTEDRELIQNLGRRSGSALRVHEALKEKPLRSIQEVADNASLSFATVASAMEILAELGISREITGRRRDRLFVYDEYLNILNEGTEAI